MELETRAALPVPFEAAHPDTGEKVLVVGYEEEGWFKKWIAQVTTPDGYMMLSVLDAVKPYVKPAGGRPWR